MSSLAVVRQADPRGAESICAIYNALEERGSTFETEPRSATDFEARIGDSRFRAPLEKARVRHA